MIGDVFPDVHTCLNLVRNPDYEGSLNVSLMCRKYMYIFFTGILVTLENISKLKVGANLIRFE